MTLEQAIRAYRRVRPELRQPREADGECTSTSEEFIHFLQSRVPSAKNPHLVHYDARTERYYSLNVRLLRFGDERKRHNGHYLTGQWEGHSVVAIGNLRIDWTARQFDPKADFPLIWRTRVRPKKRQANARRAMEAHRKKRNHAPVNDTKAAPVSELVGKAGDGVVVGVPPPYAPTPALPNLRPCEASTTDVVSDL